MSQQPLHEPGPEDDVQMPLGVGGDGAPAEEYTSESKPRINTSTLALVASFAAALAVLYFLGLQNKPRTSSAVEIQHETDVGTKIDEMIRNTNTQRQVSGFVNDTHSLVEKLELYFHDRSSTQDDIPDPFPQKNVEIVTTNLGTPAPIVDSGVSTAQALREQAALRHVADVYAGLKVDLIMIGQPSRALINKKMVSIGDMCGDCLQITDIHDDGVDLITTNLVTVKMAEEKKFFLALNNKNNAPK